MPTVQDYLAGIQNAKAAGDVQAVEFLRKKAQEQQLIEDQERYKPEAPRGVTGALSNLTAGVHAAAQGAGQLVGLTSAEDVAESNKIRRQLAQGTPGGPLLANTLQFVGEAAPSFAVPFGGAARAAGAGARLTARQLAGSGAVGGAAAGFLAPTEDPNILSGKAVQAGLGGALGAAGGPALQWALPAAGRGLRTLAGWVAPEASGIARADAQRVFADLATNRGQLTPGQVVANMAQREAATGIPSTAHYPGVPQSTAELAQSPPLTALHERLRSGTQDIGAPLRGLEAAGERGRLGFLEHELEQGKLGQLDREVQRIYGLDPGAMPLRQNPATGAVENALRIMENSNAGAAKEGFAIMRERFKDYLDLAKRTGSWQALYRFRQEAIDDVVNTLTRRGDVNAANQFRTQINKEFRPFYDNFLDDVSGGQASREFIGAGSAGATALERRGQQETAEKLLEKIKASPTVTSTGDPIVSSAAAQRHMEQLLQNLTDEFGGARLTPRAHDAIQRVREQVKLLQQLSAPDVVSRGSSTARYLSPEDKLLRTVQGRFGVRDIGEMSAGGAAALLGHPEISTALLAHMWGSRRLAAPTLEHIVQLLRDPALARDALNVAEQKLTRSQRPQRLLRATQQGLGTLAGTAMGED
jgi:hypothetical protein